MTLNAILHFAAAAFCVGLACYGLSREPRAFVNRIFAIGMVLLALDALFTGLSVQALFPENVLLWQRLKWGVAAFLPPVWLLFCLSFPSEDYKRSLAKWKWVIIAVFLSHLTLASVLAPNFFASLPAFETLKDWVLPIDWSGYIFLIFFLLSAVLIMVLLERALRAARGRQRWQVKFLTLGIGSVFATRVYTVSQALLFRTVNLQLEAINAVGLILASSLILISMSRARGLRTEIYLSQTVLHNSLTVLLVGLYFLAVGVLAKAFRYIGLNGGFSLPLGALFIFVALLGLMIFLLSDRLRQRMKLSISRHFRRPHYDYRKTWMDFTQRTASLVQVNDLCGTIVKMVSQMLDLLSVSIWLLDESQAGLKLCGSTVFSENQATNIAGQQKAASLLLDLMRGRKTIIDLEELGAQEAEEFNLTRVEYLGEARIRHCVPLLASGSFIGLMTLGDRVRDKPLSLEELDLIKTIADQVASSISNLRLSEGLRQAKEMEAFQTVAAFFVHDLKNLASKLSMTLQNLPVHFDNISTAETDLNEIVRNTLTSFDGVLKGRLVRDLRTVPNVLLDGEQIQKVINNLLINANEAVAGGGEIRVSTAKRDGWVELSVSDSGFGMSRIRDGLRWRVKRGWGVRFGCSCRFKRVRMQGNSTLYFEFRIANCELKKAEKPEFRIQNKKQYFLIPDPRPLTPILVPCALSRAPLCNTTNILIGSYHGKRQAFDNRG
jgi:putative PEP-CTERM system histidine kinase